MSDQLEQNMKKGRRKFWKQLHAVILEAGGHDAAIGRFKDDGVEALAATCGCNHIEPVFKASEKFQEYEVQIQRANQKIRQLSRKIDFLEKKDRRLTKTIRGLANCEVEDVYDGPKLKLTMQVDARNSMARVDDNDYWKSIAENMTAELRKKLRDEYPPVEYPTTFPMEPPISSDAEMEAFASATYEVKRDAYGKEYAVLRRNK